MGDGMKELSKITLYYCLVIALKGKNLNNPG